MLTIALAAPAAADARRAIPLRVQHPSALAREHRAAAAGEAVGPSASQAGPSSSASPSTVVSGGLNQPGLSASDNASSDNGSPPDTTGAIGPSHYLEIVNSRVAVYSRSTLGMIGSSVRLTTFVGGASGDDVFDPQIQWDPQGNRWFYVAIDGSDLAYGWSKTADPSNLTSTGWCNFFKTADTGTDEDYPKLGHDNSNVIIGTNVFDSIAGTFLSARVWTIAKPAPGNISSCTTATPRANPPGPLTPANSLSTHDGNSAFTPVPANTSDSSSPGWVVASDVDVGNKVQVWHVNPSDGALVDDGEVGVAAFDIPPNVPQPGTSNELDSMDARLTQAVARADPSAGGAEAVWTQHTIATSDGRSAVRWYEILPASLTLRQQGDINDSGLYAFNGAISPTSNGSDAVIQYNTGSSSQLVDTRAQSRRAATPLGAMASETTLGQSPAIGQDFTCNPPLAPCRWGDYAGASPDPNDGSLVWGSSQLNGPIPSTPDDPAWITRNFALVATGRPPAPSIAAPNPAGKGDAVQLSAAASRADGPVADYSWDLNGDGTFETDTGASPVVNATFGRVGPATVGVRVTDDRGQSGTATQQVNVANHPPVAALTATPNPAPIPRKITFDASRSTDRDGRIVDYLWDLDGNGTFETDSGTNPRASHSYRRPSRLNVKVRVRDDDGDTTDATVALINRTDLSLSLKRKQRMGRSVKLKATCSVRCTSKFTLQLSKKDAKRLHLRQTVGTLKKKLAAKKKTKLSVKLSKRARGRFGRLSKVKLTLVAVASDSARSPVTVKRTVTLRR